MLTSIGLLLVVGLFFGRICKRIGLPALIGMMVAGVLLGPFGLNTFSTSLLDLSAELRQVALIVILTRAGLSLDLKQLKKVGTSALLMSFLPATFEIVSIAVLAPLLLGMDLVSALVLGAVLAAVSPAVVVPRMLKLIDEGYGKEAAVPQLIISGASLDDVFVIVLFTAFSSLSLSQDLQLKTLLSIPLSIIAGVAVGYVVGKGVSWLFRYYRMRDSVKLAIMLAISFLLLEVEAQISQWLPFSALLAIMAMGAAIYASYPRLSKRLSVKYDQLWVVSEVFLFVLVGASLNLTYVFSLGISAVLLIGLALVVRMLGVYVSILPTTFKAKEKYFTMLAYTPKATVQAAIGGIPLAIGLPYGEAILAVSILAILLTAPLGAWLIDHTYQRLLTK